MCIEDTIALIRKLPLVKAFDLYLVRTGLPFVKWQYVDWMKILRHNEFALLRSRRASKTRDATIMAVFLMLRGYRVCWRSARNVQLTESKIFLLDNPFVDRKKSRRFFIEVYGCKHPMSFNVLSEGSARGEHADAVILDESGMLHYEKDQLAYMALTKMLASSTTINWKLLQISTPAIGSVFDDFCRGEDRISGLQIRNQVSRHTWDEAPWINKAVVEADMRTQPKWVIRQEYNAEWTAPGGAIFPDIKASDSKKWKIHENARLFGGIDFNSKFGHSYVEVAIYKADLYVILEHTFNVGDTEANTVMAIDFTKKRRRNGVSIEVEDGGSNDGFSSRFRGIARKQHWTEDIKSKRLVGRNGLTQYDIHIDRSLTPLTYKNITEAAWDEKKPHIPSILKKDNQHYIDSLMHCVHLRLQQGVQVIKPNAPSQTKRKHKTRYRTQQGHLVSR